MTQHTILVGQVMDHLRSLPDGSVNCIVTSPPYYGLRDYGVEGQIGLEKTPQEYIAKLVDVFSECRRILTKDGTAWINIADTYSEGKARHPGERDRAVGALRFNNDASRCTAPGIKPKNLLGIPWRLAFALQDEGWNLRQDIIWSKPNPMPQSVTDRCTTSHEYIFMLSKSQRYWSDMAAIRDPSTSTAKQKVPAGWDQGDGHHGAVHRDGRASKKRTIRPCDARGGGQGSGEMSYPTDTKNKRSVWEIPLQPFPEAHFATFPEAIPSLCIRAGCPVGGIVLDPFAGSGTTGMVARALGRNAILIELNPEYIPLIRRRISSVTPSLF